MLIKVKVCIMNSRIVISNPATHTTIAADTHGEGGKEVDRIAIPSWIKQGIMLTPLLQFDSID